jgi:signal transduction histidine kinase/CheY-like chemotaxis protein
MMNETPVEREDLLAVIKTSQALSSKIALEELIEMLMRVALEHSGAQRGLLILPQGDGFRISATASTAGTGFNEPPAVKVEVHVPPLPAGAIDLPELLLRQVASRREKLLVADVGTSGLFASNGTPGSPLAVELPKSVLCIPLFKEDPLVGLLYLEQRGILGASPVANSVAFTAQRVAALELLAAQAAISLENANFYQELLRESEERKQVTEELGQHREHLEELVAQRTAELTALKELLAAELADLKRLHELSNRLLEKSDLPDLLREVLQASIELLGADKGKLQLYDEPHNVFRIAAQIGFGQQFIDSFSTILPFTAECDTVLDQGQRIIVDDIRTDPRFADEHDKYIANDVVALLSTPLGGREGRLCGVLTAYFRQPGSPSGRQLRLLDLYAQQATRLIEDSERISQLATSGRQAEDADRLKSAFLMTISHELRTPLNAILGYAQMLARDPGLEPRQIEGLNTIRESGEHLLTLINDLLDLSKIEAGRLDLYAEPADLPLFLRIVADIITVKAQEKGLSFEYEFAPDLPSAIVMDEKRLRQILLNLLGNAVKFTEHGQVTLRVRRLSETDATVRLRFEIQDTGVGIGADQLELIFRPFEQAGSTQQRSGGSGLGLAISRQLVRMMGNDIHVESQLGQGSLFWFELVVPITGRDRVAFRRAPRAVSGYRGNRRRLTIIDGVAADRAILKELLCSLNFEICAAKAGNARDNAQSIADQTEADGPQLVLLDMSAPRTNGAEIIRRIREKPGLRKLPIIAISTVEEAVNCLIAGASAFVAKPIDHQLLLDLIGSLLELDWIEPTPQAVSEAPLLAPPHDEMETLRQLALVGNMRVLTQQSDHLEALDPRYGPFAKRLRDLARRYQSQAILALVNQHLKEPDP